MTPGEYANRIWSEWAAPGYHGGVREIAERIIREAVAEAVAAEREACAWIADGYAEYWQAAMDGAMYEPVSDRIILTAKAVAAAIRARETA